MRKKILAAIALVLTLILFGIMAYDHLHYAATQRAGDQLVQQIEQFRNTYRRLPASLAELGRADREEGPLYYARQSDSRYVVWYGMGLGESCTYHSATGVWTVGG